MVTKKDLQLFSLQIAFIGNLGLFFPCLYIIVIRLSKVVSLLIFQILGYDKASSLAWKTLFLTTLILFTIVYCGLLHVILAVLSRTSHEIRTHGNIMSSSRFSRIILGVSVGNCVLFVYILVIAIFVGTRNMQKQNSGRIKTLGQTEQRALGNDGD